MELIKSKKQTIGDVSEVTCPYCKELDGKGKQILHFSHLKKHGKKLSDVVKEYPNHVTMRLVYYQKSSEHNKRAGLISAKTALQMKIIKCVHCGEEIEVCNNESNHQACNVCLKKGLNNPDGRTKKYANEARINTLQNKYGNGVTNIRHIPGVDDKIANTCNERYGGVGFASEKLAEKSQNSIKEKYGNSNIMKTEEGQNRFIKYFKHKYGDNITNPLHILEVVKKLSESKKGQPSKLKGRTYEEIHGKEKAKQLIKEKRISGLKGQLKNPFISKPQKELFDLVKEIFSEAIMEYGLFSYAIDIAITDIKLAIEYDGSYWHDEDHDKTRDRILSELGWTTIRFVDKVPSKEELMEAIIERGYEI